MVSRDRFKAYMSFCLKLSMYKSDEVYIRML